MEGKCIFISVGENPRFCKRWVKQYPASLSGEFQSPTEINAPRGCAGIRLGRCQFALTRIPRQFSRARIEVCSHIFDVYLICGIIRVMQAHDQNISDCEMKVVEAEKKLSMDIKSLEDMNDAIIEDRCESILTHAGVFRADKHNTITKKLRRLEWLTQRDKLAGKYFSKELIDSIFEWKEKRNKFIHTLMKQVFTGEELGEIVMQGQTIAKTLSSKSTSYRRALDRQNR